ncbi:hypothetical protein AURDEDRAFT_109866 [Auricularia subglabra TFB-10046 SS5]|nr:hypothetical protein AURDEDRAFT_109866 [Auricularia subglabra TFB-10046 SS5]
MDRNELETYQVQLAQVEQALGADPDNDKLSSLRDELKELVTLTEAALAQAESSSKPDASTRKRDKEPTTAHTFKAGDDCLARYSGDNKLYPGRIASVGGSAEKRVYSVVFKGYNTTELLPAASVQPLPANYNLTSHSAKRKLSREEEEERERKKKKNEKKLEVRAAKSKEQSEKQQSWQKFAKKSEKKGIHIAGVSGTSIFKTPDNPMGRVGVTGSGKAMTPYGDRVKHKFAADEAT